MPKRKDESDQSESDDDYSINAQKIQIRKPKINRIDKFKNLKKIVINVSMTQYPVVSEVAQNLGWKIQTSNQAGDWDVYWTDSSIDPDILIKMHLFQKINHFPGIHVIARKNLLGHNLTNMGKKFSNQYNFFPMTWMLPQQYSQFRQYYESKQKGKTRTYIVKPQADCQGRGIFLTRKIEDMENGKHYVVQRYMSKPLLLEGLKFDMRIYVLLCGTNPLKLYLYNEGLARLATQKYQEPMNANLDKLCMHLTNYAINKFNPKFIFNKNVNNMGIGHKRALSCVYKQLAQQGLDINKLKQKIKDIIIKTIISGLPLMVHQYKFSQPQDYSGNMCFHILGLDVMLNSKGQPFVIQVNHTPSFTTDTPLDHKIKFNLIKDSLVLMNINVKQKTQLYNRCKDYNTERLLTGKRHIYEGQSRQNKINEAQQARQKYESKHLGGFQKIYPIEDPQKSKKYQQMIGVAMKMYMEQNHAVKARYGQKQMNKMVRKQTKNVKKKQKVKQVSIIAESSTFRVQTKNSEFQNEFEDEQRQNIKQIDIITRQADLIIGQPVPSTQIINQEKQIQEKTRNIDDFQKVLTEEKSFNNADISAKRDHSYSADKKQKSEKSMHETIFFNKDQVRIDMKKAAPADFKITNGNAVGTQLTYESINPQLKYSIKGIQSTHRNNLIHNRFVLKQKQKPLKMLDIIQKDLRQNYYRKMQNSVGFMIPKISSLNTNTQKQKKEKQKNKLNFVSLGKKIQSNLFSING